jgi:hypothetical protein
MPGWSLGIALHQTPPRLWTYGTRWRIRSSTPWPLGVGQFSGIRMTAQHSMTPLVHCVWWLLAQYGNLLVFSAVHDQLFCLQRLGLWAFETRGTIINVGIRCLHTDLETLLAVIMLSEFLPGRPSRPCSRPCLVAVGFRFSITETTR